MGFRHLFHGGGGLTFVDSGTPHPGAIYGLHENNGLLWYEDLFQNGTNAPDGSTGWAAHSASQIGQGWQDIATAFSDGDGIIYAIHRDGSLLWYEDKLRDGTNAADGSTGWAPNSGNPIGQGWQSMVHVFSTGPISRINWGGIYAIGSDGALRWYRDEQRDGTNAPDGSTGWAPNSGSQIGQGWGDMVHVWAGTGGTLYAVHRDGRLLWYRDTLGDGSNAPDGSTGWAPGSGQQIGQGW